MMKSFTKYTLTLLATLLMATTTAWAANPQYQWVTYGSYESNFNNDDLKKITNGTAVNNVIFSITDVKYSDSGLIERLDYSKQSKNTTKTSTFSCSIATQDAANSFTVQMTSISCDVRGYQATISPKTANAYFAGNSAQDVKTNDTGNNGATTVSTSNLNSSSTIFYMVTGENNTTYTLQNITYNYTVLRHVPKFQYKAVAIASTTAGGNVYASFTSGSFSSSTATTTSYDGAKLSTSDGMTQTAYFKAVAADGYNFVGWATSPSASEYLSTNAEYSEALTSYSNDSDAPATLTLYAIFTREPKPLTIEYAYGDATTFYVDNQAPVTDMFLLKDALGNAVTENAPEMTYEIVNETVVKIENGMIKEVGAGETKVVASTSGNDYWSAASKEVTLTIIKHDLSTFIKQTTAVWNQTISNPFTVKCNNHSLTPDSYTVTSLTPTIATYDATTNTIQTYYTSGTAQFQLTRAEDYKYNALDQTLELVVNASGEICNVLEPCSGNFECSLVGKQRNFTPSAWVGTPHQLTFQAYESGSNTAVGYVEVQQLIDGDWSTIESLDLTSSIQSYGPYDLDSTATQIRFYNGYGSYTRYFQNVRVTRKQFLTPQIDGDTYYLSQSSTGMTFEGGFQLDWSSCSDNIAFSCDNPNFIIKALDSSNQPKDYIDASAGQGSTFFLITYSTNDANADLTGTLTIYDQSQTKTITLSCEHLLQMIEWPQDFHNLEATEEGAIDTTITLNAIAKTLSGVATNQPITYTLNIDNSYATLSNGTLRITGVCTGTITASVNGYTDNGKTYAAATLVRQIRVRRAGEPCGSYALSIVNIQSTHGWGTNYLTYPITGLPDSTMTFGAHADKGSINNYLYIDFHTDANAAPDADGWEDRQEIEITAGDQTIWNLSCNVPADAKQVRFETVSSLNTYFDMVFIKQKEYLKTDTESITLDNTTVNQPFSTTFTIDYSDVPLIQYRVTNNHNLNLRLTPSPEVNNDCGEYGSYTFTLTGMSPYPQTVTDTITIFTSANHKIEIPVTITATLGETYYFNQQDGDWNTLSNWQVNGATPSTLPTASNPVVISKNATLGSNAKCEGIAYSITLQEGGSIAVHPQGGLTVHAGGFTGANADNLTLYNTKAGAGYIRISPYFTREVAGTMPTIKVLYQTRSTLDTGANKDATWQYIGAPGSDCQFTVDYITWLYQWSEPQGWINKTGTLTLQPFAGYAITQYGQPTYELTTTPIHADQTITLTKTTTTNAMNGDNLFANSFTAPIDVKNFTPEDFSGEMDKTFYIFNSGSWNEWNGHYQNQDTIGDNKSTSPGQYCAIPALAAPYLDSDYDITTIPPMQGVYVVANANNAQIHLNYTKHIWQAGSSTTDMNESMRLPQRTDNTTSTHNSLMRLRIHVHSLNSGADRMYIIQDTLTTPDYDNGYDAPNQMGEGLVNIYTNEHFGQMEVSCSNHIDSMFIGFTAGEDSIYTLTFNALIGEKIYLQDLENDSIILLSEDGCYTFNATPQTTNDMRFQVLLHPNINNNQGNNDDIISSTTDIPSAQIWSYGKSIYIANAPANSTATLYNVGGQALLTTPIHYTPYTLNLSHLPNGIYILKMNNDVYKFVCK